MARPPKPLRPIVPHPTDPSLALVELTSGYYATISVVDAIEVGRFNWHVTGRKQYASRRVAFPPGKKCRQTTQLLHRLIGERMGFPAERDVDHKNGNGLDCRRSNIRAATRQENGANSRISRRNSTGIKGVARHRTRPHSPERYVARVMVDGKSIYLGAFDTIAEAKTAVETARPALHGDFANHGERN